MRCPLVATLLSFVIVALFYDKSFFTQSIAQLDGNFLEQVAQ